MTTSIRTKVRASVVMCTLIASASWADVAVVVGAKSPVGNLTKEQVTALYLGKIKAFPGGGGTALTSVIGSGPTHDEFLANVLEKTDAQARATWSRLVFTGTGNAPKELKDSAETKQLLANNPNLIGVIDKGAVDSSVKVVFTP
jgi:ABC-type phosphate transport system substrate-binding protein